MGRGKSRLELISSGKQRNATFKKRKEGLFKKMHELTQACAVIYGPNSSSKAEVWSPQDRPDSVRRLLHVYEVRKKELGRVRSHGVSDFFHDRKRRAEEELDRPRKKNRESKYPSWFEVLDSYDEDKLRRFGAALKGKIDCAVSRIELFKQTEEKIAGLVSHCNNLSCDYYLSQQQQQGLRFVHENHQDPMMMTMMNNHEIPPHLHQINYINYGEQGDAFVNGTAQQEADLVLSSPQNLQHGFCLQFGPQIPYMGQNCMISNNMESPAEQVSLMMGWDLESGNGGLEDICGLFKKKKKVTEESFMREIC